MIFRGRKVEVFLTVKTAERFAKGAEILQAKWRWFFLTAKSAEDFNVKGEEVCGKGVK